jgi:hypothetical protein
VSAASWKERAIARWDQAFTDDGASGGLEELLVAFVRSAVVVPEQEATRRLSWALPPVQSNASPKQVAFGDSRTAGFRPDLSIPDTRIRLD